MASPKGFGALTIIIVLALLAALGGGAYVATRPEAMHHGAMTATTTDEGAMATSTADASGKLAVHWSFKDAGEKDHIPYTEVSLNGKVVGTYEGSCAEVGASGGIDGQGLVAGELSAVQCYFAGAGDEIGVFANEDGGTDIMVGSIQEPSGEGEGFRGDFKVRADLSL
jgi:hypothetical protein